MNVQRVPRGCAGLAVALAFGAVVTWPWIDPRFSYYADDGMHHALRVYVFDHLLRRGAWYPRWWPDMGFGYGLPLLNFYSPGLYYLAELVILLGSGIYRSLQWVGLIACLAGSAGAYALGRAVHRHVLAGIVVAGAYVMAPYPFVTNLYNRAALPEALGLAVLPWLLLAGWHTVRTGGRSYLALGCALAVLVLVHSLTALTSIGVLLLWLLGCAWGLPHAQRAVAARSTAVGLGLGLALSAVFWLPVLLEQGAVHTEFGRIGDLGPHAWLYHPFADTPSRITRTIDEPYRVSTRGPFDLNWTYPHATAGLLGPAKLGLGQALFLGVTLLAAGVAWLERRRLEARFPFGAGTVASVPLRLIVMPGAPAANQASAGGALVAVAIVVALACWFLNTTWATWVWQWAPLLPSVQFPWRLLGACSLMVGFAGAGLFTWLSRVGRPQWVLAAVLVTYLGVNGLAERPWHKRLGAPWTLPPWSEQLRGLEGNRFAAGTTTLGEFTPRTVRLPEPLDASRGGRDDYEGIYPPAGWIAGRLWPFVGVIEVSQFSETPSRMRASLAVPGPEGAIVAFRSLAFPGWRAYVDGRPTAVEVPPLHPTVGIGHGFSLVRVPSGIHEVQLVFTDTPPRVAGTLLTLGGLSVAVALLLPRYVVLRPAGPRRQSQAPAASGGASRPGGHLSRQVVGSSVFALTALPYLLSAALPLWRPPLSVIRHSNNLVLDFAASSNALAISSPAGTGLGPYVNVRTMHIGGQARRWLYMHPPSQARVELDVPPGAVFQAGIGIDPAAWDLPGGDGVRFLVEVTDSTGATHTVTDEVLLPQTRPTDRSWRFTEADLGRFAGQHVTLTLRTESRATLEFDWAGWADPRVYVDRSIRAASPRGAAPAVRTAP